MTVYYLGMAETQSTMTVEQLAAAVELALAAQSIEQVNGRVRAIPDVRTLRYYTTIGLLDRPAEMKGRTAYYGPRHVRQLVAVKRLQSEGLPLAEIQSRLVNASEEELARLAQVPADLGPEARRVSEGGDRPREPARVFWKSLPQSAARAVPDEPPEERGTILLGVPLDEAASLLVQAARPLAEEDVAAVRAAAQPLLDLLRTRRLID
jgi:DNA-binding transcriptional MerR regulator